MFIITLKIIGTVFGIAFVWLILLAILSEIDRHELERQEREKDTRDMIRLGIMRDRRRVTRTPSR